MATPARKKLVQKRLADIREAKNKTWSKWYRWTGFNGKTLWDWLLLLAALAIPLVVVLATIWFGLWQAHLADLQHQNDLKIAQQNRDKDLKIAEDQQQEATLKAYLDDMTTLLFDKKLGSQAVANKAASAEATIIAQVKTSIALDRLTSPKRKTVVLLFLYQAHLIGYFSSDAASLIDTPDCRRCEKPLSERPLPLPVASVISLSGDDLHGADLTSADLIGANLFGANLHGAVLITADLRGAELGGADLRGANLLVANLRGADLSDAILSGANLDGARMDGARMNGARLTRAIMPDGTTHP